MNGTLLIILSYKCLSWLCIVSPLVYVVATPSIGGNSNKKSTVRGSPCRQSLARDEGAWRRNPSAQEKCISINWAHGYNSTLSISPFQLEFIQERFLTFREWNFLPKELPICPSTIIERGEGENQSSIPLPASRSTASVIVVHTSSLEALLFLPLLLLQARHCLRFQCDITACSSKTFVAGR